ncbi:MAG: YncE family protein [Planctomycetota bacterium]|jgi:hypothetical protein
MRKCSCIFFICLLVLSPASCDRGSSRKFGDTYGVVLGPPKIEAVVNIGNYPPEFADIDFANVPIEQLSFTMSGLLITPPAYSPPSLVPGQFCYIFGDNFGQQPDIFFDDIPVAAAAYYGDYEFGTVLAAVPPGVRSGEITLKVGNGRTGTARAPVNITRVGAILLENGSVLQRFNTADGIPYGKTIQLPAPARAADICMSGLSNFFLMSDAAGQNIMAMPVERIPLEVSGGIGFTYDYQPDPLILHLPDLPGGEILAAGIEPTRLAAVETRSECAILLGNSLGVMDVSPLNELSFAYRSDYILFTFRYPLREHALPLGNSTAIACTPDGAFAVLSASGPDRHIIVSMDNDAFVPVETDYGTTFARPGRVAFAFDNETDSTVLIAAFGEEIPGGNQGRIISLNFEAFIESGLPAADLQIATAGPGAGPVAVWGNTAFVACRGDGTLASLDIGPFSILDTIVLPGGPGDFTLVTDPENPVLFVLNITSGTLIRIDTSDPASMSASEVQTGLPAAAGIVVQRILPH